MAKGGNRREGPAGGSGCGWLGGDLARRAAPAAAGLAGAGALWLRPAPLCAVPRGARRATARLAWHGPHGQWRLPPPELAADRALHHRPGPVRTPAAARRRARPPPLQHALSPGRALGLLGAARGPAS